MRMNSRRFASLLPSLCALAFLAQPLVAAAADDAKSTASTAKIEPWKPEDIIYTERAGPFRISPDAKWLVWVKSTGDKEKDAIVSNLLLSSFSDNKEIQLT